MASKTPSNEFKHGDRVNTPNGVGTIQNQDYSTPDGKWLDRWGVKHDVYPKVFTPESFKDDILYYWTDKIQRLET
jgi:hypothetical protein